METRELERTIEARVVNWALSQGWLHRKLNGVGARSWPDRMFISPAGSVVFIEFKRVGEMPSAKQQNMIDNLREHNVKATYFDNSNAAIAYLQAVDRRTVAAKAVSKARAQVPSPK